MAPPEPPDPNLPSDFIADTDLVADPEVPGRYTIDVTPAWNIFYVFGGMTMALALRAAERALDDPELTPLTANALYISPVTAGPLEIDVEILRRGKAAAQVVANLRNLGHDGAALHLTAAFGRPVPTDLDYVDIEFPDVPMPDECPKRPKVDADSPFANLNYHQQIDWRPTVTIHPDSWTPGPAVSASWIRLRNDPWRADGTIDPVWLPIAADHIGMALGNRIGPREVLVLSLEIGVQFFRPPTSPWVLQHVRTPVVEDGFVSGYVELWDGDRNLIASSAQRAKLRSLSGRDTLAPSSS